MRSICAVEVVRRAESDAPVPEPVLMQRAARALAGTCRDVLGGRRGTLRGARVVAMVGSGNNGGDALWALTFLAQRGARATIVGDPEHLHPAGAAAACSAGARVLSWGEGAVPVALGQADLVLDGILGIGGRGGVREPAADVVRLANAGTAPVVSVDVPSGVDADTGAVDGVAVRATATVCFGVLKPGLVLAPGRGLAGVLTVVDIGLRPADLVGTAHALVLDELAVPAPDSAAHKYTRGVVAVVAGSTMYPGAALLAVDGARMAGSGMVSFTAAQAAPGRRRSAGDSDRRRRLIDPVAALVVARHPDVVLAAGHRVDARCVGPGLGTGGGVVDQVLAAMADPAPLVVDASALPVLTRADGRAALDRRSRAGWITVLTPHAGEFARLGFDSSGGPMSAAWRAADQTGAVILLKGPGTVVATPESTFIDTFADANLATAGTGDVLAGLLAGLLASASAGAQDALTRADAALVAARAVGLHGLAGRLAGAARTPVSATDVAVSLRAAHAAAASART